MNRWWYFLFFIILFACKASVHKESKVLESGEPIKNVYAQGFEIRQLKNGYLLSVYNPWQNAKNVIIQYLLWPANKKIPKELNKFPVIRTPVKSVICLSTSHIALINFAQGQTSITGISGSSYITDSLIRLKLENKKICDVGYEANLNFEKILDIQPDVVLAYGVEGKIMSQLNKLEELGISSLLIGEYLENHPLGKLEWIKVTGILFNTYSSTIQKFNEIVSNYSSYTQGTRTIDEKPKVALGLPWKGTWYVSGGNTYIAQLIEDAGGNYLWRNIESHISHPLPLEKIYEKIQYADYWINTGDANSINDILQVDARFKHIKALKEGQVYNNNKQINTSGGNAYWEQGIIEPDVILADLIRIFHPEILPNWNLEYYQPLN